MQTLGVLVRVHEKCPSTIYTIYIGSAKRPNTNITRPTKFLFTVQRDIAFAVTSKRPPRVEVAQVTGTCGVYSVTVRLMYSPARCAAPRNCRDSRVWLSNCAVHEYRYRRERGELSGNFAQASLCRSTPVSPDRMRSSSLPYRT